MRLSAIKLAGFKSFVDPTTFHAPSNLTGIVGPNGCGKSNIIDAVRWVMGEGSARVLRGESMADVIFSGSSTRKPVGTASVELVFDNSSGRVTGQFAGYNEISVKRSVSRDGVSLYYLNGTRCRRKDVRDLFLGTGLGSRSYSIIEQGMISEVVEAKPEEIRAHLEEAAGISRYKERRRETERRIQHTRDNLSRLTDLREEVGKHLSRLKRQANAAERYRKLKQQKRELEARLTALQWKALTDEAKRGRQALAGRETELQESIAQQRAAEADLESLRQAQADAGEAFNMIQGELYSVGSEIARLEQAIKHEEELRRRQKAELEETEAALRDLEKHQVLDRAQVEDLAQSLAGVEPRLAAAVKEEEAATEAFAAAESAVSDWQAAFEKHHRVSTQSNREADQERAGIEVLDQRLLQAARRIESLEQEAGDIDTAAVGEALATLRSESEQLAAEESAGREALEKVSAELAAARTTLREVDERHRAVQRDLHGREGSLESLRAVQQAALENRSAEHWLKERGLEKAPRLARVLKVDESWEAAVELVLGHWLQSVVVETVEAHGAALGSLEEVELGLLETGSGKVAAKPGSLAEKVQAPDAVVARLNGVRIADSLEQAWQERTELGPGESLVTAGGTWLGAGWVRVGRAQPGRDSTIERERTIRRLEQDVVKLEAEERDLSGRVSALRQEVSTLEAAVESRQSDLNAVQRRRSEVDGQLESRRSTLDMLNDRQRTVTEEAAQLREQVLADEESVRTARGRLETLLGDMSGLEDERSALESKRSELMAARDRARGHLAEARSSRHELELQAGSRRASLDSLRQSLERMDTQVSQLQARFVSLREEAARHAEPGDEHRVEMDALLKQRVDAESRLAKARGTVQGLENDYREKEGERQAAIRRSDEIREALENARLKQQEIELNARSLQQRIEQLGGDADELAKGLPEDAHPAEWEEQNEKLTQQITRLEPVNLAAIDEYEEEGKRKDYLDKQNDDLCQALSTLESAIAKIDRKTRTRFKETFERVNKGVQELFPRLFGGGHGYLELTGEDLLTTGVAIMAQPPGKRISSLHLLSGGEKALTAVAFVFAIFRLNPAPFCLLDEVDAPLDEANVVRFCGLLKEMSETVEFILVTHNKITMEMVHQLSGVTMREPGVSRLVQVDVDEAAALAVN